jgi:diguanylate cyclase (GGDEF)-like protein
LGVRGWDLWRLRPPARRYVLAVDIAAIAAIVSVGWWYHSQLGTDPGGYVAFLLAAAGSVEVFRHIGSMHRGQNRSFHNLLSVFLFGGALVLPLLYAVLLPIPVYALLQARVVRLAPVKAVFNAAMYTLLALAAAAVHDAAGTSAHSRHALLASMTTTQGALAVVAAGAVFVGLNQAVILGLLRRVTPEISLATVLGDREQWLLAVTDVCAGMTLALTWVVSPVFFVVALAPVLLLQRSVVYRHLVEFARTDTKTGLANPSHWRSVASRVVSRTQHAGGSVAVLMVDLDHFKAINDGHGHLVGDTVLTAVADTLKLAVRPRDLVGRFGGEEFSVLLSEATLHEALQVAERIRQRISAIEVKSGKGHALPPQVTASIGVAVFGHHGLGLEELLIAADSALYEAKAGGRDRVCVAESRDVADDITIADEIARRLSEAAVPGPIIDT